MTAVRLTIVAVNHRGERLPPRTKKNSASIVRHLHRAVLQPSKPFQKWERAAKREMLRCGLCKKQDGKAVWTGPVIKWRVNCRALFYRHANIGDACGFYQAVGDFLELIGVLENDRLIRSWDGSRLLKDPAEPRIEVELSPVGKVEEQLLLEGLA